MRILVIGDLQLEVSKNGDIYRNCNNSQRYKFIPRIGYRGYYKIMIRIGKTRKNFYLHRLLAMTFISNPKNLSEVIHLDGNKLNNDLNNLAWGTHQENMSAKNWHHNKGENCGSSKLTWKIIKAIRGLFKRRTPVTQFRLAEYFGVSQPVISDIIRGKAWQES